MSGTLSSIHTNVSYALQQHGMAMSILQEQAYTGSQLNRPSDDPSSAYKVLSLNSQQRSLHNYMDTIDESMNVFEVSSVAINDMSSAVTQVKVLLTQVVSGTYDEDGREMLAEQVNNFLEQAVSIVNTQHLGQYVFGGSDSNTQPYQVTRTDGQITDVTYSGSSLDRQIEVAPGVTTTTYFAGDSIFQSDDRQPPVFIGDTGAKVGSGTSNIKGDAWLTVTNDGTNYKLSIDDNATTVTVPLAGDLTNIAVTDADGNVLYVDASELSSTGVEMVNVPGTYNIFDTLITVRDLLKNTRSLSDAQLVQARGSLTTSLDEVKKHFSEKLTMIGSKIGFVNDLKDSLENISFNTEDQITALQEVDIAQVAIDISRRQSLYEMSLAVSAKLMSLSLLDFIS